MPNWCRNVVWIFGQKETVQKLLSFPVNDFNYIIPMPVELDLPSPQNRKEDQDKAIGNLLKYGFTDWYEWRMFHWGTKWNLRQDDFCYDIVMEDDNDMLVWLFFYTAFCPSVPITEELSKLYPSLVFLHCWDEPGMNFAGYAKIFRGENIEEIDFPSIINTSRYFSMPSDDDFMFEEMKNYLSYLNRPSRNGEE